ncbi:MAG: hypothetical protein JW795_22815 [Chitinivibrionales bacterium]|nr:hypothetical protein [Chitinivibrionales bacterium]
MKKVITASAVCFLLTFFFVQISKAEQTGGLGPCLATCLLGDTRIGLEMNEGKEIEDVDWIRALGSYVGLSIITNTWAAYNNGYKQAGFGGFCVGFLWGPRPGRMFNEYKLRTKEVLLCIPLVQCYPMIALPLEAFSGKTMSAVIEEENLKR